MSRGGFGTLSAKPLTAQHVSSARSILTAPVGLVWPWQRRMDGRCHKESRLSGFYPVAGQVTWVFPRLAKGSLLGLASVFFFVFAGPAACGVLALTAERKFGLQRLPLRHRAQRTHLFVLKLTGGVAAYTKKLAKTRVHSRLRLPPNTHTASRRHRHNQLVQERRNCSARPWPR